MQEVKAFIIDHLEEVHNKIGGVIGYRLQLSAEETEQLLRLVEVEQPYLEVAEKAAAALKRDEELARIQASATYRIWEMTDVIRAAVDKLK